VIESEVEPLPAPKPPPFWVIEYTFIDDPQNGSYNHQLEGTEEEIEALVADLRAKGDLEVEVSRGSVETIAYFREENAYLLPEVDGGDDDDDDDHDAESDA
jgi:hypothetical protein